MQSVQYVAYNYLSAMGGFLQSIINGYGGVRLHHRGMELDPALPPNATSLNFIGLDYLGSSIDIYVTKSEMLTVVTRQDYAAPLLRLYVYEPEENHQLLLKQEVRIQRRRAVILPANAPLPSLDLL